MTKSMIFCNSALLVHGLSAHMERNFVTILFMLVSIGLGQSSFCLHSLLTAASHSVCNSVFEHLCFRYPDFIPCVTIGVSDLCSSGL